MICNHAHQKLFPFIVTGPHLLLLSPFPLHDQYIVKLPLLEPDIWPFGTTLNCRLAQTTNDMPSGHVGHLSHLRLLGHWTYSGMPSGPYVILGHLRQLGHPSHLGHLSHLSNIGDLNTLNPYPLDCAPTDSHLKHSSQNWILWIQAHQRATIKTTRSTPFLQKPPYYCDASTGITQIQITQVRPRLPHGVGPTQVRSP
jgi:hypothetical protein